MQDYDTRANKVDGSPTNSTKFNKQTHAAVDQSADGGFIHDVGRHRVEVMDVDDGIVTELYLRCRRCGQTARAVDDFRDLECPEVATDGGITQEAIDDTNSGWAP